MHDNHVTKQAVITVSMSASTVFRAQGRVVVFVL